MTQRLFKSLFPICLAVSVADAAPTKAQPNSVAGFSGFWVHPFFPGIEPPPSGPGPIYNKSRRDNGASNNNQWVGDDTNPILKPGAAAIVKSHGDISRSCMTYPTPSNRCWPSGVPYIFFQPGMQLLQKPGE